MSLPQDPWERREAERRRLQSHAPHRGEPLDLVGELRQNQRALVVLVGIVILLIADIPRLSGGVRTGVAIAGAGSLLVGLALWRDYAEGFRQAMARGVNLVWGALLLWSAVAWYLSPYRVQASGELLRLLAGAAAFWYGAYALRTPRERGGALAGVLLLAVAMALADFVRFGQQSGLAQRAQFHASELSFFGTHESVGTLLGVLLPLALALAVWPTLEDKGRIAAQLATVILAFAWVMARCRSAWLGGMVALLLVGGLLLRYPARRRERGRGFVSDLVGSPALLIILALVFLAIAGGIGPLLTARVGGVGKALAGGSLYERLVMWQAALHMLAARPITGFGLSAYPVLQGQWTHQGDADWQVLMAGTSLVNIAHNYYLQWAADTGIVGLALFVALLGTCLHAALRALPATSGFDRPLLIGATGAAVSLAVTAVGSPSFHMHGVWALSWLLLGLGFGVARSASGSVSGRREAAVVGGALAVGVALGLTLLAVGKRVNASGAEPRGTLELRLVEDAPYMPGQFVTAQAVYSDGRGVEQSTFPGAQWGQPQVVMRRGASLTEATLEAERIRWLGKRINNRIGAAQLQVRLPDAVPTGETMEVWLSVEYQDRFGRRYQASSIVPVEK